MFGALCFATIPSVKVKKETGVGPRGQPCAYLGDFGRRGIEILFRNEDNTFHITTTETGRPGESLHWPPPHADGKPAMAFARDYKDLSPITVRGTAATRPIGHPGMSRGELDKWIARVLQSIDDRLSEESAT